MSSSDEIKERIEHYFNGTNVPTTQKDWKRISKFTLNGETVREFGNTKLGRTVYTVGEEEDAQIYELDQWTYGIHTNVNFDPSNPYEPEFSLCFEPSDRFSRTGYIYDQHQQHLLETFHFLPAAVADEAMENSFVVEDGLSVLKIHILLAKHGFKHNQSLTDFINDTSNGPAPQTPTPPINPPMPPALDPAWVPPAIPAPTIPMPAAPTVPAPGAPSVPVPTPTVPVTMPIPASDFLFAMVDQEDGWARVIISPRHLWEDDNEITDQSVWPDITHLIPSDWIEETESLFKCGRLALRPAMDLLISLGFERNEEFQEQLSDDFEIFDPLGFPSSATPVMPRATPRSAPRVGPSPSKITGMGSFSPPPVAEEPEEEPEADLPEVDLEHDAGDDKVKFRKEFWDAWKAKDPLIPTVRFRWSDRYRERKAEVTGLGFAFHLQEYTGIKLRMGYLDEQNQLVEQVLLPSSAMEELFKDFGGEFDDGQIQFIYKRPDTSAEELLEEIKPMLLGLGWKEIG